MALEYEERVLMLNTGRSIQCRTSEGSPKRSVVGAEASCQEVG